MGRWDSQTPTPRSQNFLSTNSTPSLRSKWDETPIFEPQSKNTPIIRTTYQETFFPTDISGIVKRESFSLSDDYIDHILPESGYEIFKVSSQNPERFNASVTLNNFSNVSLSTDDLAFFKDYFDSNAGHANDIKTLKLLLQLKKGNLHEKKLASKTLITRCEELGVTIVFGKLISLLMQSYVTEKERHLFVNVLFRLVSKLGSRVEPFCAQILVIAEPLLVDNDFFVRCEGKDLITNLARAVGLLPMLHIFRQDMEHSDERVRNTTCRAFAVVSLAVGLDSVEKFLWAVLSSKKSWEIRQSGLKSIQHICLSGAIQALRHASFFFKCIFTAIADENPKVQITAFLALSSMLEIMDPHGFELIEQHVSHIVQLMLISKGKLLTACVKSLGSIFKLSGASCTEAEAHNVLIGITSKCFANGDVNSRKICICSLATCLRLPLFRNIFFTENIHTSFRSVLSEFILALSEMDKSSWQCLRYVLTCILSNDASFVSTLLHFLQHGSNQCKKTIMQLFFESNLIDGLEHEHRRNLIDSIIEIFINSSDEVAEDVGTFFQNLLETPFHSLLDWDAICMDISTKLQSRDLRVRLSASIVAKYLAKTKRSDHLLTGSLKKIAGLMYENLDEDDPWVLAQHIETLDVVFQAVDYESQMPSLKDSTLRIAAILRNRNEKVQESCARFLGKIAVANPDVISVREWMRICFELIDLLGTSNKLARREAMVAFGAISKAIGPSDLLIALLNNLKVQERQNRLCTTIAIAVVAQNCGPFTVLASLMNEYRIPELNVQNGALKSLSFLFEYCGPESQVYGYSLCGLLEDALSERDLVHRQIACNVLKHLSICSFGTYAPDLFMHMLNYVWPNILETAPHVLMSVIECIESLRINLGSGIVFNHVVQGLYHPARKVREIYWRMYNNLVISSQDYLIPSVDSDIISGGPIDVVF